MTTKQLLSLLARYEPLKTPENFRLMAGRIASDLVQTEFNPRSAERFLEIVPWHMRQAMAALIVERCHQECRYRDVAEPKGGVAQRIDRTLERIRDNTEQAQLQFEGALLDANEPEPEPIMRLA